MTQPDPWFRMYHSTLDNPKVQKLAGEQFKAWINFLCLSCRHGGRLPSNSDIAFALRINETKVEALLKRFIDAELIDAEDDGFVMHDWDTLQFKSDVSTTRVKRFRQRFKKRDETVSGTPSETDQIQNRTEQNHPTDDLGKPRPSRIPEDWKPTEKDTAYAADRKLDSQTITNVAEQFVNHWRAKPSKNTSLDWSRQWRTWVQNHIAYHGTGPYPNASRRGPKDNSGSRQSLAAARNKILAEAGVQREPDDNQVRDNGHDWTFGESESYQPPGPVIDADDWQRVPGPADGNEGPDAPIAGDDGRLGGTAKSLSETLHGLSSGRGSPRTENAA